MGERIYYFAREDRYVLIIIISKVNSFFRFRSLLFSRIDQSYSVPSSVIYLVLFLPLLLYSLSPSLWHCGTKINWYRCCSINRRSVKFNFLFTTINLEKKNRLYFWVYWFGILHFMYSKPWILLTDCNYILSANDNIFSFWIVLFLPLCRGGFVD